MNVESGPLIAAVCNSCWFEIPRRAHHDHFPATRPVRCPNCGSTDLDWQEPASEARDR